MGDERLNAKNAGEHRILCAMCNDLYIECVCMAKERVTAKTAVGAGASLF